MKIEVRNLKTLESLSEETLCFTATIYVDGVKAFEASNDGHGGCDFYHEVAGYKGPSEIQINEWMAANRPKHEYDLGEGRTGSYEHTLELEVGDLIAKMEEEKAWSNLINRRVVIFHNGNIYTGPAKFKPEPKTLAQYQAAIEQGKVKGTLVNGAPEAIVAQAKAAYLQHVA